MTCEILNTIGLTLGIVGVCCLFVWGPPQPSHETGWSIGLGPQTPIDEEGRTVEESNREVEQRKRVYARLSKLGLVLLMVGFACQLVATWLPGTEPAPDRVAESAMVLEPADEDQ